MDSADLAFAGAALPVGPVRSREVSPREITQVHPDGMDRLEPHLDGPGEMAR